MNDSTTLSFVDTLFGDAMHEKDLHDRLQSLNDISALMAGERHAYMSCGIDARWYAKRSNDGTVICSADERSDARSDAEKLGYVFNKE